MPTLIPPMSGFTRVGLEPSLQAPLGSRHSTPKKSVKDAWDAWQDDGNLSSGSEFLASVVSWREGTAAQLLRQRELVGVPPPTSVHVQERLCHYLAIAARGHRSTYVEALATSRTGVINELRRALRKAEKETPE